MQEFYLTESTGDSVISTTNI